MSLGCRPHLCAHITDDLFAGGLHLAALALCDGGRCANRRAFAHDDGFAGQRNQRPGRDGPTVDISHRMSLGTQKGIANTNGCIYPATKSLDTNDDDIVFGRFFDDALDERRKTQIDGTLNGDHEYLSALAPVGIPSFKRRIAGGRIRDVGR